MGALLCIPRGLESLVIVNILSLGLLGSAACIFLYFIAGPIGLIIPAIVTGILLYIFKRKNNG